MLTKKLFLFWTFPFVPFLFFFVMILELPKSEVSQLNIPWSFSYSSHPPAQLAIRKLRWGCPRWASSQIHLIRHLLASRTLRTAEDISTNYISQLNKIWVLELPHFRQSTSINILLRCLMDIKRAGKLAKFSDVPCLNILGFPFLWEALADQDQVPWEFEFSSNPFWRSAWGVF